MHSRVRTRLLEVSPDARWGPLEYLLADTIDYVQYLTLVTAFKGSGKDLPKIKPVPRPTDALRLKAEQEENQLKAQSNFALMAGLARRTGEMGKYDHISDDPPQEEPLQEA